MITDELEKQRQALQDAYNAEVADLRNKQKNDKDLTQQSREAINQIIINKQKKLQQDLAALDAQEQQRELQTQQQTLQLRLTQQSKARPKKTICEYNYCRTRGNKNYLKTDNWPRI